MTEFLFFVAVLVVIWIARSAAMRARTTESVVSKLTSRVFNLEEELKQNPVRYDVLKRLVAVQTAAGRPAEADNYLQQAITWRQNVAGEADPAILTDMIEDAALCRSMHDYDRALGILEGVRNAHIRAGELQSAMVAADFSRIAQVYLDQKKPEDAAEALTAALS